MRPRLLSIVGLSFSLSAVASYLMSGCALPQGSADCGGSGLWPAPAGPFSIDEASMKDRDEPLVVDPVGGTLTIERERVTVRYERLGKKHQIVYAVLGPP